MFNAHCSAITTHFASRTTHKGIKVHALTRAQRTARKAQCTSHNAEHMLCITSKTGRGALRQPVLQLNSTPIVLSTLRLTTRYPAACGKSATVPVQQRSRNDAHVKTRSRSDRALDWSPGLEHPFLAPSLVLFLPPRSSSSPPRI